MNAPPPPVNGVHVFNMRERRALMVGLDTETTDSDPSRAKLVQLAVISHCPGYMPPEGQSCSLMLNPGVPMPPSATAVNGLTDEMLHDKPKLDDKLQDIVGLCSTVAQPGAVLVGYNVRRYDFPLLRALLAERGLVPPMPVFIDVYDLAHWHYRHLPSLKLSALADALGVPFQPGEAHEALADIRKCFEVLAVMRKQLGITDDLAGDHELVRLSALAAVRGDAERDRYSYHIFRCRDRWAESDAPFRVGMGKQHCGQLLTEVLAKDLGFVRWFCSKPLRSAPRGVWDELDRVGWLQAVGIRGGGQ